MRERKDKTRRGFVLPPLLMVCAVIAVLAGAVVALGNVSMQATRFDKNSEQSVYASEAGLALACEDYIRTQTVSNPSGTLSAGRGEYQVSMWENTTNNPFQVPNGPQIPPQTVYMLSTGTVNGENPRRTGALFSIGQAQFQVGALGNQFLLTSSTLDAYNSDLGLQTDPAAQVVNSGLLASNQPTAIPSVIDVGGPSCNITGNMYVGPGGDPSTMITVGAGSTVTGATGALSQPVTVNPITVPNIASGAGTGTFTYFGNNSNNNKFNFNSMTITPPQKVGDPIVFQKMCFTMKFWADGSFLATETGSGSTLSGNIYNQVANPGGNKLIIKSWPPNFKIMGKYHEFAINTGSNTVWIEKNGPTVNSNYPNDHQSLTSTNSAPNWLGQAFGGSPTPSVTDPGTLNAGKYKDVVISGTTTNLQGGTYVIDNLTVQGMGKLQLLAAAGVTDIYVTGSLTIDGQDTILNTTLKAPNLNIYYTGTTPVTLSGGAQAYFSLFAPNADINMNGFGSSFFGALVGKVVTVTDCLFHYDTATAGVGTGYAGSGLNLVSRHRL